MQPPKSKYMLCSPPKTIYMHELCNHRPNACWASPKSICMNEMLCSPQIHMHVVQPPKSICIIKILCNPSPPKQESLLQASCLWSRSLHWSGPILATWSKMLARSYRSSNSAPTHIHPSQPPPILPLSPSSPAQGSSHPGHIPPAAAAQRSGLQTKV